MKVNYYYLIQFQSLFVLCCYNFIIADETSNDSVIMSQSHQPEACSSSSSQMTTIVTNKNKKTNHCGSGIPDGIVILLITIKYKLIIMNFR